MTNPSPPSSSFPAFLLFFVLISSNYFASSRSHNSLYRGSSLSVEDDSDILTSSDSSFTCGFYEVGTNAYCFSIWFTNSANRTVVWMANRDDPVSSRGSRISLQRDGTMVLKDIDGSTVWSTNTTATDVDRAELLSTGNLVLKNPQGMILWQSFDYPTDTLLPGQRLTKSKKLVSAMAKGTYYSGYFSFYFDNDNVLRLIYDGPEISSLYWPNPDFSIFENGRTNYNSSRFAVLDEMGMFKSSDKMEFSASNLGFGIKRRLKMDYDGNLRLYSLNEMTRSWEISWEALGQQCYVHGLCGRNGICVYTPEPKCSCPPGYDMSDPSNWNKGCKPRFNHSCTNRQKVKFVELPHTDFWGFDLNSTGPISFKVCMKSCLEDCSCQAFSYRLTGKGVCYTKSALFNGYMSPSFPGTAYIKLRISVEAAEASIPKGVDPICPSSESELLISSPGSNDMGRGRGKWLYLYSFVSALGAVEIIFITSVWWCFFRRHGLPRSMEDGYRAILSEFRRFSYGELKKATNKFKEELGRGGSGAVYKGVLSDERVVAVKKLENVFQGDAVFWAEMSTIGRIYHMNLVRLWGFCSEGIHRLLVYEFIVNQSLDKHLFGNLSSSSEISPLEWKDRFKIAVGIAKGLSYLHHECLEWVIHCDVKPENILLDSDFEPKIADFGLSKLSQRGGSGSNFSQIRGTKGYMAPEWTLNLPITAKVDVYSYGVVLLEIVRGIRVSNWVSDDTEEEEAELKKFIRVAKMKIEDGEDLWIEDVIDPRLKGKFNQKQAASMIEVGVSCVEDDRNKRPTMDMVVQALLKCEDGEEVHHENI